jgi:uncharacterized protein (TIGR00255 family)
MIKSMTGYGKAVSEYNNRNITVEVRSLNSKSIDLNLRFPNTYKEKELELRAEITKQLERGKIDINISFEQSEVQKNYTIHKGLAKAYYEEIKSVTKDLDLNIAQEEYLNLIMRMPDIMTAEERAVGDEAEWQKIMGALHLALAEFNKFRQAEGNTLEKDLTSRVLLIESLLNSIEVVEPQRIDAIRTKMEKGIAEMVGPNDIDKNRFEQELIYYLEKVDITEERVRLHSHCDYFLSTMKEAANNGRKLSFIAQEIGREINTIGSKANNVEIQQLVVQMKDELEKIKEQLNNVL